MFLHYKPMGVWEEVPMTMTTGVLLTDDATQTRAGIANFLTANCGSTRRGYATDCGVHRWRSEAGDPAHLGRGASAQPPPAAT
jgi:hypothetical protein